ncbi:MAG: RNA-binding protein [Chloroflexota bacterium]
MKIFIGNLCPNATEPQLYELFAPFGTVDSVHIMTDQKSGQPRGFAYVEMSDGGNEAIQALNQCELDGHILYVNGAWPYRRHFRL